MIKVFGIAICVVVLVSCGGGGSGAPANTSVESYYDRGKVYGKYDIQSYSNKGVDTSSLTGTWMMVLDYDMEYSYDGTAWENAYRRYISKSRSLVSIIDDGEMPIAFFQSEYRHTIDSVYVYRNNGKVTLELLRGYLEGDLTNNSMIVGNLKSDDEDKDGGYLIFHRGKGALIKISSNPALPGLAEGVATWGSIFHNVDYIVEEQGSAEVDATEELAVHFFREEEFTWQRYENGVLECTDEVVSLDAVHIAEAFQSKRDFPNKRFVSFGNYANYDCYDNPIGWRFRAGTVQGSSVYDSAFEEGMTEELVSLSEVGTVVASYYKNAPNIQSQTFDLTINVNQP